MTSTDSTVLVHADHCDLVLHDDCCGRTDPAEDCSCNGPWLPIPYPGSREEHELAGRLSRVLAAYADMAAHSDVIDSYRGSALAVLNELRKDG